MRCQCDGCGHGVLVAFSCKHHGRCPSCGVHRMAAEEVQVVDGVVPNHQEDDDALPAPEAQVVDGVMPKGG